MQQLLKYKIDHVLFWTATIAFHVYTRADLIAEAGMLQFIGEVVVRNGLLALIIYVNLLVLVPRYAKKEKWLQYLLFLFADILFYAIIKNTHDAELRTHMTSSEPSLNFYQNAFYNFSIALFYTAFSVALHLSREWFTQQELIRKIEMEKINTELEYLKAQLNPHFLFNSINTIFFQIDRTNVVARDTLSTFSDMLRYQLYECNEHEIMIEKEVSYIRNYVDLQRLRLGENYWISCVEHNMCDCKIAPLLLIPFVENAFKHVSHLPLDNEIRIDLWRKDKNLRMFVYNTCDNELTPQANGHGIGLKNVQRRLALLYPNRHSLELQRKPGNFQIKLEIIME